MVSPRSYTEKSEVEQLFEIDVTPANRIDKAINELDKKKILVRLQEHEDGFLIKELTRRSTTRLEEDEEFKRLVADLESEKRRLWHSISKVMETAKRVGKYMILLLIVFAVFLFLAKNLVELISSPLDRSYIGLFLVFGVLASIPFFINSGVLERYVRPFPLGSSLPEGFSKEFFTKQEKEIDELAVNFAEDTRVSLEEEYDLRKQNPFGRKVPKYATQRPFQKVGERHDEYTETQYLSNLTRYIEELDKGSIGIAGERGYGKTSLMRALERNLEDQDPKRFITAWLSAPTAISEETFLLSVLAKLATRVGGKLTKNEFWPGQRPEEKLRKEDGYRFWKILALFVSYLLVIVGFIYFVFDSLSYQSSIADKVSILLFVFAIPCSLVFARRFLGTRRFSFVPKTDRPLVAASAYLLEELWYERKDRLSSEVSLAYFGVSLGGGSGSEKTRQPFTLPHLIQMWDDYVGYITNRHLVGFEKVVVFIDEIDKIKDSDKIGEFMRILKALYNPMHLFFVVSISEDAYALFQTKMSPIGERDEFDSSFDQMFYIMGMNYEQIEKLLNSRILGYKLPVPVLLLIWMLSRGNPREVLRLARKVLMQYQGEDLDWVAYNLCSEQLRDSFGVRYQSALKSGRLNNKALSQLFDLNDGSHDHVGNKIPNKQEKKIKIENTRKKILNTLKGFNHPSFSYKAEMNSLHQKTLAELMYVLTIYELFCYKSVGEFKKLRKNEHLLHQISSLQNCLSDESVNQVLDKFNELRPCLNLEEIEFLGSPK